MSATEASAVGALASEDRARVYRTLSRLFRPPDEQSVESLRRHDFPELRAALGRLGASADLRRAAKDLGVSLAGASAKHLGRAYHEIFEASGGLRCSPHETAHTAKTGQQALTKTFELADVAGFYRAFGVELTPGTERADHIAAELEFMHLLAVKEAVARRLEDEDEHVDVCREAARTFLGDHLGRWTPCLAECLEEAATDPLYSSAGRVLEGFVKLDAAWLGVSSPTRWPSTIPGPGS
jgi:DMSO reductase family type II enzyme chaperone